ncbi:hypothetical protein OVA24_19750 [Luteolibacter sp. SL250]|uniref:hypothetical protein n=1 Tax=Luteolibacter sp. SL250 TaxID=2995170 RepID=UPI00226F7240|nr:hypothetical protein [Luteolibacter sp. SL250]WAC19462.1 hypothetical protein OVA24_19750 [Luteolibacter sp. SL250]
MNLKTLSFTTLTLAAALLPADAYFRAGFKIDKEYRQFGSEPPTFRSGEGFMYIVDGTFTQTGCALNDISPNPFPIDTQLGCNIGSNAVRFIGSSLVPQFFELVGVEAATVIEPGRHDLVSLYARPSYEFPVNGLNIASRTTVIFYNLQSTTGDVKEYRLAGTGLRGNTFDPGYAFRRLYGPTDRSRMEREITNGIYQFRVPSLGRPERPLYLNFPVTPTVEGYVEGPIRGGFRFINVGPMNTTGFAQYDINLIAQFRWEGLTSGVSSGDRLYIGFRRLDTALDPDSTLMVNGRGEPVFDFPPPGADINLFPGTRIRLDSPVQSFYNLPPGFFTPARSTTMLELTLERDPGVGLSSVSTRRFQLPIRFVAGFPGAMAAAFPKDTPAALMDKNADPDGDGVSNWLEWLSGTDPYTANAPAALSQLAYVPASTRRSGQTIPGYWHMSIDRRANLPAGVTVTVESSTDLETWAPVSENDPHWIVEDINEEPRIRILSRTPELTDKRYFRVKYNDPG